MSAESFKQREYLSFMAMSAWYMLLNQSDPVATLESVMETVLADQAVASSSAVSELLSRKGEMVYTKSIQQAILDARPTLNHPGVPLAPMKVSLDEPEDDLGFLPDEEFLEDTP